MTVAWGASPFLVQNKEVDFHLHMGKRLEEERDLCWQGSATPPQSCEAEAWGPWEGHREHPGTQGKQPLEFPCVPTSDGNPFSSLWLLLVT